MELCDYCDQEVDEDGRYPYLCGEHNQEAAVEEYWDSKIEEYQDRMMDDDWDSQYDDDPSPYDGTYSEC